MKNHQFLIVVPAYNRALRLRATLASVRRQSYSHWRCLVLDDGSQDDTYKVAQEFASEDSRFQALHFPTNQGSVAMNEIGMSRAADDTNVDAWVRLGSDDEIMPHKLMLDDIALRYVDSCYGIYRVQNETYLDEIYYSPPMNARGALLSKGFAGSWASVAVKTSVLRKVREVFGGFGNPGMRYMDDWLVNTRIAQVSPSAFTWRGLRHDGSVCVGARTWEEAGVRELDGERRMYVHDAFWRVASDGASSLHAVRMGEDATKTVQEIEKDFAAHPAGPQAEHLVIEVPGP